MARFRRALLARWLAEAGDVVFSPAEQPARQEGKRRAAEWLRSLSVGHDDLCGSATRPPDRHNQRGATDKAHHV